MFIKIALQDLQRKKISSCVLFIFVMLSAFLLSVASSMVVELIRSLEYMSVQSQAPDFVQLNNGNIDQAQINQWAHNDLVKKHQVVEVLNIHANKVYLGNNKLSAANSIMSFDFVTQNPLFDFILNMHGQVIHLLPGQIAVPVYFMQQNHLKLGDSVVVASAVIHKKFIIAAFARDYLMNPSIVHSKRFLINQIDFDALRAKLDDIGSVQYLIEFQLRNQKDLNVFTNQYQRSDLPHKGPVINVHLLKILNSVTDGSVVGILILLSVLLAAIAMLALRLTILVSLEEDYKQIGIMKAIGIRARDIKKIYLLKYTLLSALACFLGYLFSLLFGGIFKANILLFLGAAPKSFLQIIIPLLASAVVFILIINFCLLVISKIQKISATESLRTGIVGNINNSMLRINKNKLLNINVLLSLKDVLNRRQLFALIFSIFLMCTFMMIVPINFINTLTSPNFIAYLGIGRSDARIDLQGANNTIADLTKLISYLNQDESINRFSILTTNRYEYIKNNGATGDINVEIGDFSVFPIKYLQGTPPVLTNQLALSYLNSKALDVKIGDQIELLVNGVPRTMTITGIYQDITNGGMTAKAVLPDNRQNALWEVINIDFKPNINIHKKIIEYNQLLKPARVTYINDYLNQTLGDLIKQIKVITCLSILVGFLVAILIASLFLRMLIAKDYAQIAIMQAIGFSLNKLRMQYATKLLVVLSLAITVGVLISNIVGQKLVSFIWSFMGAPQIVFVMNYVEVYVAVPILLILIISLATILGTTFINKVKITKMIFE